MYPARRVRAEGGTGRSRPCGDARSLLRVSPWGVGLASGWSFDFDVLESSHFGLLLGILWHFGEFQFCDLAQRAL